MKKFGIISFLFALIFTCNNCYARTSTEFVNNQSVIESQNRIDRIGFNILNSNGIEKRTVFDFDASKTKNACSRNTDRQIIMYRGLYNRLSSDDEVAAILSHEISHSVDSYNGGMRGLFTPVAYHFASKKYEYKADKRGVDYMVNAGYNPVAMIVVMSKAFPQARYDWMWCSHPLTSRRMMEIYAYIYKKYPEYLANNKYKDNPYYQNFLLTSKENRARFQKKVQSGSKGSVKYL
ncbi:MAG: M48 family metalloprotease [bacterium]|nr:M48 family metalloprotease [bacterium]